MPWLTSAAHPPSDSRWNFLPYPPESCAEPLPDSLDARQGISSFTSQASSAGICVAVAEKIQRNADEAHFDETIAHLAAKPEARGVIMFVDEDNIR